MPALNGTSHVQARADRRSRSPRATAPRPAARRHGRSGAGPSCRRPPCATAWPSVMPTSSTVWWPSMCRSPLASISRSIRPWRAIWSSMWSKKPMPVDSLRGAGAVEVRARRGSASPWCRAGRRRCGVGRSSTGFAVKARRSCRSRSPRACRPSGAGSSASSGCSAGDVLDQHAARLHAVERARRVGHAHQDHVGLAGERLHAGQLGAAPPAAARARSRSSAAWRAYSSACSSANSVASAFSTLMLYGGRTLSISSISAARAGQVAEAHAGQAELAAACASPARARARPAAASRCATRTAGRPRRRRPSRPGAPTAATMRSITASSNRLAVGLFG